MPVPAHVHACMGYNMPCAPCPMYMHVRCREVECSSHLPCSGPIGRDGSTSSGVQFPEPCDTMAWLCALAHMPPSRYLIESFGIEYVLTEKACPLGRNGRPPRASPTRGEGGPHAPWHLRKRRPLWAWGHTARTTTTQLVAVPAHRQKRPQAEDAPGQAHEARPSKKDVLLLATY